MTRADSPRLAGSCEPGRPRKGLFSDFLVFQILKILPATRTCLTQAGARASHTFRHPIWVVESRSGTPFGWLKAEWKTPVESR